MGALNKSAVKYCCVTNDELKSSFVNDYVGPVTSPLFNVVDVGTSRPIGTNPVNYSVLTANIQVSIDNVGCVMQQHD